MKLYAIKDWDKSYENNRSRTVKELGWVAIPNRHDGEGYNLIMSRDDAAEIFAAWVLIIQVASRCHPRGTLVRDNGRPHTPDTLSIKTRGKAAWFNRALEVLSSDEIGWLEVAYTKDLAPDCQETVSAPSVHGVSRTRTEQKGMEGNGREQNDGETPARPYHNGDTGGDLPVELPPNFPKTEAAAKLSANAVGCPEDFAAQTWHKAKSRGGSDAKDVPIRYWASYLKTEWTYEQQRQHRDRESAAKPNPSGRRQNAFASRPDRNAGTTNEGDSAQYRGVGYVAGD